MEERQDTTKNVKILLQMLKDEKLKDLRENVKVAQGKASSIVKKLGEKENELKRKQRLEEEAGQRTAEADGSVEETTASDFVYDETPEMSVEVEPVRSSAEKAACGESEVKTSEKAGKAAEKANPAETEEPKAEEKPATEKAAEKSEKKPAKSVKETKEAAEKKADKVPKTEEKPAAKKTDEKPAEKATEPAKEKLAEKTQQPESDAAAKSEKSEKTAAETPKAEEKPAEPPKKSILSFIVKKADPAQEQREKAERARKAAERNAAQSLEQRQRPPRPGQTSRPAGDRPFGGPRPSGFGGKAPAREVAFIPPKDNKPVKKKTEKSYEEKRNANNKKLHVKELTVADFDENKTGYRKVRKPKQKKEEQSNFIKIEKAVITKEFTPIKELSEKFGISAVEITKRLFKEGITKTINDSIDFDTAAFIADDLGIEVTLKLEKSAEDLMNEGFADESNDGEKLVKRPPIVTVMGHVDHGKTSLLDKIRSANVAEGEAGGITQHIGAYSVEIHGNKITFIDTPGHAAFTAMRARGAQVTDIAIIVVAADDGIKPQTIEAINHAKAAGVDIIVAANKIDRPHIDLDRVRQQLSELGILVEEWGGDVIMVPVSAKTGEGVEKLLESILLVAEMEELKANPDRKARGTVIEAKLDKGKGPLATVLVQNGTLHVGDNVVAGTVVGRVRAMINDKGSMVKTAGPSDAVSILGLEDVPNAGDAIFAVDEEKLSKLVAEERRNKEREDMIRSQQKVTLDDLFSKISEGELKNLNLIIKADVQGSAEAVKQSLTELSNDEVKVNVLHAAVGAINETDVTLAESSNAIIIGFNVRPDAKAKVQAERTHVDIKLYRIIYDAIDDVTKAMKGMLAPKFEEIYTGKAEVRDTFRITGVGTVAGCYVTDGKIVRSAKLRIYRNDVMICEGNVLQLKRFKDEVKEVNQGYECGISIEGFNDIKVGDFIESYIVEEKKQ